jgi:hypothetical protein
MHNTTVAILLCFTSLSHLKADEDTFTPDISVSGNITWQTYSRQHKQLAAGSYQFLLGTDFTRWIIQIRGPDPVWNIETEQDVSYNGSDIFYVNYSDEALVYDPRLTNSYKKVPETNCNSAIVHSGPFPLIGDSAVALTWLTFCGGGVLSPEVVGVATNVPNLLMTNPRHDPLVWACDLNYKCNDFGDFRFLLSADFTLNKAKLFDEPSAYPELDGLPNDKLLATFALHVQELRASINTNLIVAHYEVSKSVHRGKLTVPTECIAKLFTVPQRTGEQSWLQVLYTISVTNINNAPEPQALLPRLAGTVNIEDQRVRVNTSKDMRVNIKYTATDNKWIVSTNDARIRAMILSTPPIRITRLMHRDAYTVVLLAILAGLLLLPTMVLFKRFIENRIIQ